MRITDGKVIVNLMAMVEVRCDTSSVFVDVTDGVYDYGRFVDAKVVAIKVNDVAEVKSRYFAWCDDWEPDVMGTKITKSKWRRRSNVMDVRRVLRWEEKPYGSKYGR